MIIRKGIEKDRTALKELLEGFQMSDDVSPEEFLVAEESGEVAGTVRLEQIGEDFYLRAMAVHTTWQGHGIGAHLVKRLVEGLNEVKVVARGSAVTFYKKLGFQPVSWEVIHKDIRKECLECSDLLTCKPVPMIYERKTGQAA